MNRKVYECIKSELDIFLEPSTNTSISNGIWVDYYPLSTLDKGPIEFRVPSSESDYFDLSKTTIYVKCTIKNLDKDNKIIGFNTKDLVAPTNNFLHSLFSQVDISFNNTNLESTTNTYPYKAYIEDLCNYGEDSKNSFLQSSLFYKDSSGQMENLSLDPNLGVNNGFITRREKLILGNGTVELIGKPHLDILNTDRYIINNVEINIKFTRSKDSFALMSEAGSKFFIEIDKAILFIRKVTINPTIILAHSLALEKKTAKYPIKKTCVKPYTIGKDFSSQIISNINQGILPNRIVICMIDCESYNGAYNKNPYNFQHFNLSKISIGFGGSELPYKKPFEFDFSKNLYIRGYFSLFENIDRPIFFSGNDISRSDYPAGYTLFAYDFTPDLCNSSVINLLKKGDLTIELEFKSPLEKPITVLVFMEFDVQIEINKNRQIFIE